MHTVSIIIPVKPGGAVKALENLQWLDFPPEVVEILVAEGRAPSRQRNRAAEQAEGEILYFLDDDSLVSPGFLRRALPHYDDPKVAAVGGPSLTPENDSLLQRSFGLALSSLFGGGGVRNRYRAAGEPRATGDNELILCNLSFRRGLFREMGGFNEALYPNEENELMDRIRGAGFRLIHDPALAVERSQRRNWRAFRRQLFGYGRGRGEQTLISGKVNPVSLVPSCFVLYLLSLPLVASWWYGLPLFCYLLCLALFAVEGGVRGKNVLLIPLLLGVFPVFHLCYGLGMIVGMARFPFRTIKELPEPVITRIKGFADERLLVRSQQTQ